MIFNVINLSHQFHQKEFLNVNTERTDMTIFRQMKCLNTTKLFDWDVSTTVECAVKCSSADSDLCKFILFKNNIISKSQSQCIMCICPLPGLNEYTVSPDDYEYTLMSKFVGWYQYTGYSGKHIIHGTLKTKS